MDIFLFCSVARIVFALNRRRSLIKDQTTNEISNSTTTSPLSETACDTCVNNKMTGTVKPYDRHVVICDVRQEWPKHVEEVQNFPYNLFHLFNAGGKSKNDGEMSLKVTVCRHVVEDPSSVHVIIYPENVLFVVKEHQVEEFAAFLKIKNILSDPQKLQEYHCQAAPWKKLILVCAHEKRDKRCFRIGPQVIAELRSLLKNENIPESEIAVKSTSHIGGHEFAGTLIVYPSAEWYGQVTKSTAKELLTNIRENTVLQKCFRGKAKLTTADTIDHNKYSF